MSHKFLNSVTESSPYSILDMDLNEITQNLYLGDKRTAKNKRLLRELGVKRIVVAG